MNARQPQSFYDALDNLARAEARLHRKLARMSARHVRAAERIVYERRCRAVLILKPVAVRRAVNVLDTLAMIDADEHLLHCAI